MTDLGSLSACQILGNEPTIAAIRGPSRAVAAVDPEPVVHRSEIERPVSPEAAIRFRDRASAPLMAASGWRKHDDRDPGAKGLPLDRS